MHTKIVATIGPSTESEERVRELIEGGLNIARMNFSHDVHEAHGMRIDRIRKWSKKLDKKVEILCDLQGPKIRVKQFPNGPKRLEQGEEIVLTTDVERTVNDNEVAIEDPYLHTDLSVGDVVLLDDGQIELVVKRVADRNIFCKVVVGGDLYPRKGVNVPLTHTTTSSLTDKDIEDLRFILTKDPEWIAISFVQNKEDVQRVRQLMGDSKAKVMCKIEKAKAIDNIFEIIEESDGIMIARGDLGVELPYEKLPIMQKQIIKLCNYAGKPVVTATQMMSSMINAPFPTRAETSDVANAVFDGTDAVMLSNETAVGHYPVETVKAMRKIANEAEDYLYHRESNI